MAFLDTLGNYMGGSILGEEETEEERRRRLGLAPVSIKEPAAPTAPVAPDQVQMAAAPTGTMTDVTAPTTGRMAAPQPAAAPQPTAPQLDFGKLLADSKNDPRRLSALAYDDTAPEWVRKEAGSLLYDSLRIGREQEAASQRIRDEMKGGNMIGIAREMEKRGEEGSVLKAAFYNLINMPDLAEQERIKLGAGKKFEMVTMPDGTQARVLFSGDGLPLRGYNREGISLTQKELAAVGSPVTEKSAGFATGTRVRDAAGTEWSQVPTRQGMVFYNNQGQRGVPQGKTVPVGIGSDLDLDYQRDLNRERVKLEGLKAGERIKTLEAQNAIRIKEGRAPFSLSDLGLDASGEFTTRRAQPQPSISPQYGGQAQPAAPAAAPAAQARPAAPAGGPVSPEQVQPAPAGGPVRPAPQARPAAGAPAAAETTGAIERRAQAQAEIVKKAGDVVANSAQLIGDINSGNTALTILETKPTNFGAILQGQIPGEQAVGRFFGTQEARDTQTVMEVVDKVTAAGAKALGANPTDRDLSFLLQNRPNERWPAASVADWIRRVQERSRVALDIAQKQVESGGAFVPQAPESVQSGQRQGAAAARGQEKVIDGVTYVFDGRGWKRKR